jgi:hypothetical protein
VQVWDDYGDDTPELQDVARRTLSAWTQAVECERNWKDLADSQTKKRNRLGQKRAEKITFVKSNRRLLRKVAAVPEERYNWVGVGGVAEQENESDGSELPELSWRVLTKMKKV